MKVVGAVSVPVGVIVTWLKTVALMADPVSMFAPLNVVVPEPAVYAPFIINVPFRIKLAAGTSVAPAFTVTLLNTVLLMVDPERVLTAPLKITMPEATLRVPSLLRLPRILNVAGAVSNPEPVILMVLKFVLLICVPVNTLTPFTMIVPELWLKVPLLTKFPATVNPVEAPEPGALKMPAFENDPTETSFVPLVNVLALFKIENAFDTAMDCVNVTMVPLFVLTVRLVRFPEIGISNPVACDAPV